MCLPAFGAVGGSHDSVLPRGGGSQGQTSEDRPRGTSHPPPHSALCLFPHPVLPAVLGRAPHIHSLLVAWAHPLSLPQICSPDLLLHGPRAQTLTMIMDHLEWVPQPHGLRQEGQ